MQKGKYLEGQIDKLCKYINSVGFHAHKNHPLRTVNGTYLAGEPYDYEVFARRNGEPYHACFDTKECMGFSWHMQPKDVKQADALKHCKNAGVDAFFLIYFVPLGTLIKIDVDDVIAVLQGGSKTVPSTLGMPWDVQSLIDEIRKGKAL